MNGPFDIDVEELAERLGSANAPLVVDVREPWEVGICALPNCTMAPMRALPAKAQELPKNRTLVVLCHHGVRSLHVAAWLRRNGFDSVLNLRGGIDAWARRVDPSMPIY